MTCSARIDHPIVAFRRCRRGVAAVEFAIIAPMLLALVFGIVVFGSYLAVVNAVEQLTAEAARASVAGLSDTERAQLAQQNVASHASTYPFVDQTRLTIVSAATDPITNAFSITVQYDASSLVLFRLPFVQMPSPLIRRSAAIQRGGF